MVQYAPDDTQATSLKLFLQGKHDLVGTCKLRSMYAPILDNSVPSETSCSNVKSNKLAYHRSTLATPSLDFLASTLIFAMIYLSSKYAFLI